MIHSIYISIHNLCRRIGSQNSTVELDLWKWTLQMLIYKGMWMKITKIFSLSTPTRDYFKLTASYFTVKSASLIFQQTIDRILTGLPVVSAYIDDIIVTDTTPTGTSTSLHFCAGSNSTIWISLKVRQVYIFPNVSEVPWIYIWQEESKTRSRKYSFDKEHVSPNGCVDTAFFSKTPKSLWFFFLPELRKLRGPLKKLF